MFYARSMKFGGLLVHSDECNQESFQSLGLLCPVCSKIVFWKCSVERSGYTNSAGTKVKSAKIPAYFSHFPIGVQEENTGEICEARVRKYDKLDLQKNRRKVAAQRRKDFENRILKMFKFNPLFGLDLPCLIKAAELDFEGYLKLTNRPKNQLKKYKKLYVREIRTKKFYIKSVIKNLINQAKEDYSSLIQLRLQLEISLEVLDYLFEPTNGKILEDLVLLSAYCSHATKENFYKKYSSVLELLDDDEEDSCLKTFANTITHELLLSQTCFFNQCKDGRERKSGIYLDVISHSCYFLASFIVGTRWAIAFNYLDSPSEHELEQKYLKHYFCNAICQDQNLYPFVTCHVAGTTSEPLFDLYENLSPDPKLQEKIHKLNPLSVNSPHRKLLNDCLEDLGIRQEEVFLVIKYFSYGEKYNLGVVGSAYLIKSDLKSISRFLSGATDAENRDFINQTSNLLADGFFYTSLSFGRHKNSFSRRLNKVLKSNKLDEKYFTTTPTVVAEWAEYNLYEVFLKACADFLLQTSVLSF